MKRIVIVALLSVFVAAPAVAADTAGGYVGVKLGQSDVTGSPFGFGVYGGYNAGPIIKSNDFMSKVSFAGEAEYTDFGSNSYSIFGSGITVKAYAIGAAVAATYPINPQFSVIAKAGLARSTTTVTCAGGFCPGSNNTIGLRYGAAGQYNLTQAIGLRVGYDAYPDYSMMSVGAVMKF